MNSLYVRKQYVYALTETLLFKKKELYIKKKEKECKTDRFWITLYMKYKFYTNRNNLGQHKYVLLLFKIFLPLKRTTWNKI